MNGTDHQLSDAPMGTHADEAPSKQPAHPVISNTPRSPSPRLKSVAPPKMYSDPPAPSIPPRPPLPAPTVRTTDTQSDCEGGEGVNLQVNNAEFISAIFSTLPPNASAAICSKVGDPTEGAWFAKRADAVVEHCLAGKNNYVNCSSFTPSDDETFKARKDHFAACHFLLLDDLGGKLPIDRLARFEPIASAR